MHLVCMKGYNIASAIWKINPIVQIIGLGNPSLPLEIKIVDVLCFGINKIFTFFVVNAMFCLVEIFPWQKSTLHFICGK